MKISLDFRPVGRVDERSGLARERYIAPYGIAVDSHGDVKVGEVSWTVWDVYLHPVSLVVRISTVFKSSFASLRKGTT